MTTHAMIDIETLATSPEAVILSVGGVKFDPYTNEEPHTFFDAKLDIDAQTELGRDVDQGTIEWWGKQSEEVRNEALGDENRTPVLEILQALNKWCVGVDTIWCQGPAFDICILENLYRQYNHHIPWAFWKIRDSRTLFGIMPKDPRKEINFAAHNALEDAKVQALCVQQTLQTLKLEVR